MYGCSGSFGYGSWVLGVVLVSSNVFQPYGTNALASIGEVGSEEGKYHEVMCSSCKVKVPGQIPMFKSLVVLA